MHLSIYEENEPFLVKPFCIHILKILTNNVIYYLISKNQVYNLKTTLINTFRIYKDSIFNFNIGTYKSPEIYVVLFVYHLLRYISN